MPFGDRNPKGSVTRILKMLAPAGLEDTEVLLCLMRAYTIARDTRTIRSTHVDAQGQANRMPLFCTLVERFVQARIQRGKWDYSWQHMEEDLAADTELARWWAQQGTHVLSHGKGSATCQADEAAATPSHDPFDSEPFIPGPEWDRQESAHFWGECLLEALVTAGYQAEVRVRPVEHGYHLVLRGAGDERILETTRQVQDVIKQIKRASRSSWSSCPPNGRRE